MGKPTSKVSDVRVPGPLAGFAAEFKSVLLKDAGYTPLSAVTQMRLMVHLSRWLGARQLSAADLTEERIQEYLLSRRAAGYTQWHTRRSLAPLLDLLTARHARPVEEPAPPGSATGILLASFQRYLLAERGLACSTASAYVARAARFITEYATGGELATVTAGDVTRALLDECATYSVGSAQYFVAALRSFLRFCHVEGLIEADLSAAALGVTGRRPSLLPKGISDHDAQALLRSCDRRRAVGRRDYAVVLALLRLGLRPSEVAMLGLGDIDWRAGEIVVRGKGGRDDRLPLPVDVGEAIAGYLQRGRPATSRREVFVTAIAPVRGLSRESVSDIVRRACVRAGIRPVGAHRLRHTLACAMVRADVPLPQIGQALRHHSLVVTAGYARVDLDQLRHLAQPWPGGDLR